MMTDTFMAADLHLGHAGMVNFKRDDGVTPQRPWATIEEHDDAIISNWNKVVRPKDKVFVLGDVVINRRCLPTLARLNGIKTLIMGNHDVMRADEYLIYFDRIYGCKEHDNALLSHMPVHENQMYRYKYNVHGHMHHHYVEVASVSYNKKPMRDTRYRCVSLEQIDYTPISWEMLKKELKYLNGE